jgi:hypothetical protein
MVLHHLVVPVLSSFPCLIVLSTTISSIKSGSLHFVGFTSRLGNRCQSDFQNQACPSHCMAQWLPGPSLTRRCLGNTFLSHLHLWLVWVRGSNAERDTNQGQSSSDTHPEKCFTAVVDDVCDNSHSGHFLTEPAFLPLSLLLSLSVWMLIMVHDIPKKLSTGKWKARRVGLTEIWIYPVFMII